MFIWSFLHVSNGRQHAELINGVWEEVTDEYRLDIFRQKELQVSC